MLRKGRSGRHGFHVHHLARPGLAVDFVQRRGQLDPERPAIYIGKDDYEVVIDFNAWATDFVRSRHWHSSQEFSELPDGCSRLRLRLNSMEEIERWVLTWGVHATVVRPKALADRLRKIGEEFCRRYASSPDAQ